MKFCYINEFHFYFNKFYNISTNFILHKMQVRHQIEETTNDAVPLKSADKYIYKNRAQYISVWLTESDVSSIFPMLCNAYIRIRKDLSRSRCR